MFRNQCAHVTGLLVLSLFACGQVFAQSEPEPCKTPLECYGQALKHLLEARQKIDEHRAAIVRPRYSLTCQDLEEKTWESRYQCLTDGRIHLIYYHDKNGRPGKWDGITFSDQDFALLMRAVKEGAQIWVGEAGAGHRVLCVDVGTSGNWDKGPIVCSSTTRIYADWKPGNHSHGEWNRYFSNGHREYQHVRNFDQGSRKPGRQAYRWYIRY